MEHEICKQRILCLYTAESVLSRLLVVSRSHGIFGMSKSLKRRDLNLKEKKKILDKFDALPKCSQREAAQRLEISQPTLSRIVKNRYEIEKSLLLDANTARKRKRCGKDKDVEDAMRDWFFEVRKKDARIDGQIFKWKAEQLAKNLGKDDFAATDGWLSRWLKRENITFCKPHGEQGEADSESAERWIAEEWPKLIKEYSPNDIYNADETGFYFRALPDHTYVLKN